MKKIHEIKTLKFIENKMQAIIDGKEYIFQLEEISPRLLNATDIERNKFEISASGYGIHWPLIDEDLSIDGLLGIKHSTKYKEQVLKI